MALNYRLVAALPESVRRVIAFGGRLRGDCDEHYLQPVSAAILHIASDEYYPSNVTGNHPHRLRRRVADIEFLPIDGGPPDAARPQKYRVPVDAANSAITPVRTTLIANFSFVRFGFESSF